MKTYSTEEQNIALDNQELLDLHMSLTAENWNYYTDEQLHELQAMEEEDNDH